jgi:hypothetical protein
MPLRHEEMVLHKSRTGTGTGTWRRGRTASHYTGQTYVCMKSDKVSKLQEKFDEINPMIMYVTQ